MRLIEEAISKAMAKGSRAMVTKFTTASPPRRSKISDSRVALNNPRTTGSKTMVTILHQCLSLGKLATLAIAIQRLVEAANLIPAFQPLLHQEHMVTTPRRVGKVEIRPPGGRASTDCRVISRLLNLMLDRIGLFQLHPVARTIRPTLALRLVLLLDQEHMTRPKTITSTQQIVRADNRSMLTS